MNKQPIKPVRFEAPQQQGRRRFSLAWLRLAVPAALLLAMALFVLNAASLRIVTDPVSAQLEFAGPWPRLALGDRWLLRPGDYVIRADASGYQQSNSSVQVGRGAQTLQLALQPLPGKLAVEVSPDITGRVRLNGVEIFRFDGDFSLDIPPGTHQLEVDGDLYTSWVGEIQIRGYGETQSLALEFQPAWSTARIQTQPAGASIRVDGQLLGQSPLEAALEWGVRRIEAEMEHFYPQQQDIDWQQHSPADIELDLRPREVQLSIRSQPEGATVTLNGKFFGQTPVDVEVTPLQSHQLRISRAGFRTLSTQLELPLGQSAGRDYSLEPLLGRVVARVEPASATLYLNDKPVGTGNQELELPATPQRISVRAAGYRSQETQVIPNPEIEQLLTFRLLTESEAQWANLPDSYRSAAGDEMLLFREPGRVQLGSDRSETERRANEVMWQADLQRSIYVSRTMVTNEQFRAFTADHSSGNFNGLSLDGARQPVVNISWQQAALYANWLSEREGLQPFYATSRGFVSGLNPQSNGYRLMTEAEWVWLAAMTSSGLRQKYPWGDDEAPQPVENFAGSETAQLINFYLQDVADDFRVSAPVGSFAPNRRNLFDMAGNAAEWIQDWYDPVPYSGNEVQIDPLGPDIGEFRVIRGASWARGYQPQLRLAYRDYGATARNDVGFRMVRYAN